MRAAVLQGGEFEICEVPEPTLTPGRLLIAPIATGICGSDLHFREQQRALWNTTPAAQRHSVPGIIPGHEFSGTVVAVGAGVDGRFQLGSVVTAIPFTHGSEGPECIGLSSNYGGGLAELCTVDAVRTELVPDAIPPHLAALTEPLAVGLHASRLANRVAGPNVVIGCGPVGLAVIFALRAAGRGPILAADFSASRRAAAEALGADLVIDPAVSSPYAHWPELEFTEGLSSPLLESVYTRPDAPNIFDCVGAVGLIDQVMTHAPVHSHVVVVGACTHRDHFEPIQGIQKELTLEFSFAYTLDEFRQSLQNIARYPDLAATLITQQLPLADTAHAFDVLAEQPEEVKILIAPQAADAGP